MQYNVNQSNSQYGHGRVLSWKSTKKHGWVSMTLPAGVSLLLDGQLVDGVNPLPHRLLSVELRGRLHLLPQRPHSGEYPRRSMRSETLE